MSWSNKTWESTTPIYDAILKMPFIKELMDGSLPVNKFQFYISQDSYYLDHFGRALALIGARAQSIEDALAFIRFGEGAIVVENALHQSFFTEFNIQDSGDMQPACHHYVHFLKSKATLDNIEVAMAAVLPCFWIYKKVGDYIYQNQTVHNNPYQKWIDTYAGEEFGILVERAISICDKVAEQCTPQQQALMTEAFITSSRLEWAFWDAAYHVRIWNLNSNTQQSNL